MSLLRFKYLHRQHILTLILILTITSTLFSLTAFTFLGIYNGLTSYVGEEKDIVAIYGSVGRTPFSGLVPTYLAERMNSVNGVLASSPEVIAPSVIKGQSIFIRGIVPEGFSKLNALTVVEGDTLNLTDVNSVIVGNALSEKLGLKVGDKVLVLGVLAEQYAELQVKGIYASHSTMDDEALVPLYVGQWLRGTDYSHVTLIRVKIDTNKIDTSTLYAEVAKEASESNNPQPTTPPPTPSEAKKTLEDLLPSISTVFKLNDVSVQEAQDFMKSYLNQYGVTKETIVILSLMVLIFASATGAWALKMFMDQHKREIDIIRSVGASGKKIKADLLIKVLSWSLVSSTLGIIIASGVLMVFEKAGYLQVLSHSIVFQLDPLIIVLNFALISFLVVIGITRSGVEP